jgi:ubiquinone/menaquinone biosynthesis C-methylase UbiE
MASIQKIAKAYRGKLAEKYDAVRDKQERWHLENDYVAQMLEGLRGTVMDCPVGTGRFLKLYKRLGLRCSGVDSSEAMLAIARKKERSAKLWAGDATALNVQPKSYDTFVCVRFLNLIEEEALKDVMNEIDRVTKSHVVLTIRLGEGYHSNSSMATHDEKKFRSLLKRHGWKITREELIFNKGWFVMRLDR